MHRQSQADIFCHSVRAPLTQLRTNRVARETFSANVEADAERTATNIAKQLNSFFQSKGWIPTVALK